MTEQRGKYPVDYTRGPESTNIKDQANEAADQAMDPMKDTAHKVQRYAEQIGEQAVQYGEKAQETAQQYKSFVEKSLREQPMTTLAVAAVIGFILGAVWKK
jgi:ElaB/YqjD/DUF883 family membrane-anchored ribosome-binding protein